MQVPQCLLHRFHRAVDAIGGGFLGLLDEAVDMIGIHAPFAIAKTDIDASRVLTGLARLLFDKLAHLLGPAPLFFGDIGKVAGDIVADRRSGIRERRGNTAPHLTPLPAQFLTKRGGFLRELAPAIVGTSATLRLLITAQFQIAANEEVQPRRALAVDKRNATSGVRDYATSPDTAARRGGNSQVGMRRQHNARVSANTDTGLALRRKFGLQG